MMKTLQIVQKGNVYSIFDATTIIYTIEYTQNGTETRLDLKNAYDEQILHLYVQYSGFKLFRTNKISSMNVSFVDQEGTILPREHSYVWTMSEVSYTFICGELAGGDALIMSDHEETLGYASKDGIVLQHCMYSAELSIFFIFLIISKDKIQLDSDKFTRAWTQVQS